MVTDGAATFPLPDKFVQNHPKPEVEQALAAAYQPPGTVTIPFTPIVINTGSKLVLVDTGYGPEMHVKTKGRVGQLPANLAAAGIDPKSIDTVIISHMHLDHVSGPAHFGRRPRVPERGNHGADGRLGLLDERCGDGQVAGRLHQVGLSGHSQDIRRAGEQGNEIRRGQGNCHRHHDDRHARPHARPHLVCRGFGSAKILVQSDVTNIPHLFLRHPTWQVMYDVDPLTAAETRKKFYDMAAAEKALVQGFHFPFPSAGHVEKVGTEYRLVPIPWNPVI